MIDGLDNNERIIGTTGIRPSIEAISEISIQSNTYTAEVGRTAGGVINIITKSGSNNFHTVTNSSRIATTSFGNHNDRPNQPRKANLSNPSISRFFDPTAFAPQPSGTLGTERKNPLYGPHYRHVDLSLFKNFPISRETFLQLRAECFNIANTTNFAIPPNTSNNMLQSNPDPANPDVYAVSPNNIGTITNTSANYNPRLFQFALKYQF